VQERLEASKETFKAKQLALKERHDAEAAELEKKLRESQTAKAQAVRVSTAV
jgi:hypothetical protein